MATGLFHSVKSVERNTRIISGHVSIAASGVPTIHDCDGAAVARTAAGKYTITTGKLYDALLYGGATFIQSAGSVVRFAQIESTAVSSTGAVQFDFIAIDGSSGGAVSELDDGSAFNFILVLENSSGD